jgi:hypothetical protein
MVQLFVVLAFIGLALVYFGLLYGGLRLLTALNLIPREWFPRKKRDWFIVETNSVARPMGFAWEAMASSSATSLDFAERRALRPYMTEGDTFKFAKTSPLVRSVTGPPVASHLVLLAFKGQQMPRRAWRFGGDAAQYGIHTSIQFYNVPKLPVTANNRAFSETAIGDLTWRS